jgi:hypothetical protein
MKESTLAKITAAATAAKRTAQKALTANPNPEWTEHEMQSIDDWIAHQDVKIEALRSHPPPGRDRAEGKEETMIVRRRCFSF